MPKEEKEDKQDRIIKLLEEILRWIKVTSIPSVKKLLLEVLASDEEKIAYHNSDGRTSREVAKFVGVDHSTISKWWKNWIRAGIAESVSVKGGEGAKRIFSLEDFGIDIEIPKPKVAKPKEKEIEILSKLSEKTKE